MNGLVLCGEHEHELDERIVRSIGLLGSEIREVVIFEGLGQMPRFEGLSIEGGVLFVSLFHLQY